MGLFVRMKDTKSKDNLSVPEIKKVYGYTVRKLPLGRFLEARDLITQLPNDLVKAVFPDSTIEEAINVLLKMIEDEDYDSLIAICIEFITYMPEAVIELVAHLIDEDRDILINDENLGVDGLVKLIMALIEVNKLGEAIENMRGLIGKKNKDGMKDIGYKS